jgi:hypothetical protein
LKSTHLFFFDFLQSDAAHFLGVFTKQSTQAKELAKYGYASLQATVHLSAQ